MSTGEALVTHAPPGGLGVQDLTVRFGNRQVLERLTLDVGPGEIAVIVGPSGCGKSTLLRAVAGLVPAESGEIRVGGDTVQGTADDRMLVFQDDALLPWLSAVRNVELPLKLRGVARAPRRESALEWLREVGLSEHAGRLPRELSGGMRQRVQLARTLIAGPRLMLMDEPFGALDAQTRSAMQKLLLRVWLGTSTTVLFVTHDVDEALRLGDRVFVLGSPDSGPAGVVDELTLPEPRSEAPDPSIRSHIVRLLDTGSASPRRSEQ